MPLDLQVIKRTDPRILSNMSVHYSQPKGFVGRNICYAIIYDGEYYGSIVGGSATLHLPGRNEFFSLENPSSKELNQIINNIFFHVDKVDGRYPMRWFTVEVLEAFREKIAADWKSRYGDDVVGFESLVELPRTGECYKRDGWELSGQTKGFTCKRVGGKGSDSWSGKRVWNTDEESLRPKLVFVRKL